MPFLIPERDNFDIQRADMSLGLRRAARYYNELVVPGIGGAWKIRHFSWPVAAIYLKQQSANLRPSPTSVAHGLEALGNKIEWTCASEKKRNESRLRGMRAFSRNPEAWRFGQLSQRRFYVQVTHRQMCTRALGDESGLGFTQLSTRFNTMTLTPSGQELAEIFLNCNGVGRGKAKLFTNLNSWILGNFDPSSYLCGLKPLLGPHLPSRGERNLVYGRLQSMVATGSELGKRDPERRYRLIRFFENKIRKDKEWNETASLIEWLISNSGGACHAKDILTAMAFEDMRHAGVNLLGRVAEHLGHAGARLAVRGCAAHDLIRTDIETFRRNCRKYRECTDDGANGRPDAMAFAWEGELEDAELLRALVNRDGRVLCLTSDDICAGPIYRSNIRSSEIDEQDSESRFTDRPSRLFQFIALWRDCRG